MNVCVYARSLGPRPTGRGTVALELLRVLGRTGGMRLDVFAGGPVELPGCRIHLPPSASRLAREWYWARGIAGTMRACAPDLVWSPTHLLPSGLSAGPARVVTVLDLVWRDRPDTMALANRLAARWAERRLGDATRIVCISSFTRDRLAAWCPAAAERASVVHLAANPRLALVAAPDAPEPGVTEPYVLTVGTFEPRKNLGVLLEAVSRLPGIALVHCGGAGWKSGPASRRAATMPAVTRLGYVDEARLARLHARALAAVYPSLYEGFHLPPLDAASLGCPVIASDIPVHREILGDGAAYAPPDSPETFAALIRWLAGDPAARADLARRGRARAAEFTWERSAARLRDVFDLAVRDVR